MDFPHEVPSTDSMDVWWHHELPDGSSLSTPTNLEVNATCNHSESQLEPLPADSEALSFPPRSFGLTGSLSLHDYRKHLAQAAECVDDPVDRSEKPLKRKTATSNLNRPPALSSTIQSCAESVSSSAASSPPPLSPSYSHSVISQRSEQEEPVEAPLGQLQPGALSAQGPRVSLVSENLTRPRPNRKRLNTFREKLEARGQVQHSPLSRPRESRESDQMLATTQAAAATISHGGAYFEILNPRKSLDLARIVSFIEDVDTCSYLPHDCIRDSEVSSFSIDQGLDRTSLSQFTDASLPSHYSSHSLYTSLPSAYSTPKRQTADIPSSSPGVHDRIHSLSEYSLHENDHHWASQNSPNNQHQSQNYYDIPDSPQPRMASISERLERDSDLSEPPSPRPPSSSQPTFYSGESEIGEPGSPVYANGEWSQVDERDRGIFLELPSPYEEPPSPYETYLQNTMSPSYSSYDPSYDHIYFDPHVQSVLAAANAENMGLRGHPAGALDDLQRRFQSSLSLSDGNRKEKSQRKKLRKFFSWRSGN